MVTAVEAPREARGGSVRDGAGRVVLSCSDVGTRASSNRPVAGGFT